MPGPIDKDWLMREAASEVDDRNIDLASLPKCPECGYILYKATHLRCPECGTPFSPEDLYYGDTRRQLERRARLERRTATVGIVLLVTGAALVGVAARGNPTPLTCFVAPLVMMTLWTIVQRLFLGDPLHNVLLGLGIAWLLVGLFVMLVR